MVWRAPFSGPSLQRELLGNQALPSRSERLIALLTDPDIVTKVDDLGSGAFEVVSVQVSSHEDWGNRVELARTGRSPEGTPILHTFCVIGDEELNQSEVDEAGLVSLSPDDGYGLRLAFFRMSPVRDPILAVTIGAEPKLRSEVSFLGPGS